MAKKKQSVGLLTNAASFMLFMGMGWFGLMNLVQAKRDVRQATKGLDSVEEMDPLERMRRRYGLGAEARDTSTAPISSLEEELDNMKKTVNIDDFDYVPVPRPADDDE